MNMATRHSRLAGARRPTIIVSKHKGTPRNSGNGIKTFAFAKKF